MNKKIITGLSLIIILAAFIFTSCVNTTQGNLTELQGVEVRDYQGENLSAIADFRENSIKGPQVIDIDSYKLAVTGLVKSTDKYTYDQVLSEFPGYEKVVTLNCVEGWSVTILWEGVLVKDLLNSGKPLDTAKTVIFHAYDGYTTSIPLKFIEDKNIMLAYKMNGVVLPAERGFPFQLVAEDKWGYKWIKWVTEIELSADENYKGYWEQRGYSNSGDLEDPIFGP